MSSIIDLGSKYGTYLGERAVKSSQNQSNSVESERLSKEENKLLKCGEPVRFGLLTSLFRLESSRLVICSSGLSTSDSALVKTTIGSLSGKKPDSENLCLKY